MVLGLLPCVVALLLVHSQATLAAPSDDGIKTYGSHASTRFAYTSIFYTGTPRDWEYFCALRVMFETVRATGTPYDRVAIVAEDSPEWIFDRLHKDGIVTTSVGTIPNPYENRKGQAIYQQRFVKVFNKLLAWRLEKYERVMLLDSDLLFLDNSDELFFCGSFCAVYVNPCIFHTGMVGLKPSKKTLDEMIAQFDKLDSYDGGDQGFLNSFFSDLLAAPLFEPRKDYPPGSEVHPSTRKLTAKEDGLKRLAFGYHLDHFYYYQRMRWEVPCSDLKVVGFPGVSNFKPWYWWTWPFLPLALDWHAVCARLDECHPPFSLVALHLCGVALVLLAAQRVRPATWAVTGAVPFGARLAAAYLIPLVVPIKILPTVIHPYNGWALFFMHSGALTALCVAYLALPARAAAVWAAALAGVLAQSLSIWPTVIIKAGVLVAQLAGLAGAAVYGAGGAKVGRGGYSRVELQDVELAP